MINNRRQRGLSQLLVVVMVLITMTTAIQPTTVQASPAELALPIRSNEQPTKTTTSTNKFATPNLVDIYKVEEMVQKDRAEVLKRNDKETLLDEVLLLQDLVKTERNKAIMTNSGIKVLPVNVTTNIHKYQTMSITRLSRAVELHEPTFKLPEEMDYVFEIDVLPDEQTKIIKPFNPELVKIAEKEIIRILNSDLPIKKEYLSDTRLFISPYELEGVNGYFQELTLESDGSRINTVVIADAREQVEQDPAKRKKIIEDRIRDTLLHELGHAVTVGYSWSISPTDNLNTALDEYLEYYPNYEIYKQSAYTKIKVYGQELIWSDLITENYAEDFRLAVAPYLGIEEYVPMPRLTGWRYNPEVKDYMRDTFLPDHFKKK